MDEGREYTRRTRMRGILLLAVVLVVGVLLGAAGERYRTQGAMTSAAPTSPRQRSYPGALGRMELTASQRATIDSLLELERPRFESIVQRVLPDLRAEAGQSRSRARRR